MRKPPHVIEIFLQPGELYFGDRDTRIRTVLGSCVSLTLWHPGLLVGGMCHYMLPGRLRARCNVTAAVHDGRYADEAIAMLSNEVDKYGAPHREYQIKLFGGGNMFPGRGSHKDHVGMKNVETARRLVALHGFNCVAEHLGGQGHRNVIFDVWSGHVWVRHADTAPRNGVAKAADDRVSDRGMLCAAYV